MKFYDRENEIITLKKVKEGAVKGSKMSVIVGRRRIGKTKLIHEVYKNENFIYFFVAKKEEKLLCEEFVSIVQTTLSVKIIGKITRFADLFEYLLQLAENKTFTLAIDEFQEFYSVNRSIYSEMQNLWDKYKDKSKLNLLLSGSIYSLMKKIFENAKEPLFGRANRKINLKPFSVPVLKRIMVDHHPDYTPKDLLTFYMLTGGVAKYVELFVDENDLTHQSMIDSVLHENSYFLTEGKDVLIEEFGKEYSTYFSILSLIASSKTSRSEIESILEKNTGGYLDRLENEYNIIKRVKPVFAKEKSRTQKYLIEDNFLSFWFRFIYKYKSAVEIGNFNYLKSIVDRDFSTYAGRFLEKYFIEQLKATNEFSQIGTYWERGHKNEIDIVAVNDLDKRILFADVKINKNRLDLKIVEAKSEKLVQKFKGWTIEYKGFSLEDLR
ncbi:MAG: ATP-binding protein [Desulfobacteraceae bacterium]|nr:ATP-binding protein [Desulfobacteraceae bacterium]